MKKTDDCVMKLNTVNQLATVFQVTPITIYRILRSTEETQAKESTERAGNDQFSVMITPTQEAQGETGFRESLRFPSDLGPRQRET
jgi:hypothetical protein